MLNLRNMLIALFALFPAALAPGYAGQRIHWEPLREPGSGGAITSLAISPHEPLRVLVGGDMLGAGVSEDAGDTWLGATGFASWEIADFTCHPREPKVVWVGTMSGPYLSQDGGRTWTPRRNGFPPLAGGSYSAPVQKVLIDPADPARLLAFGGSKRRWSSPGRPLWGAVWESRDSGASWRQIATLGDGANVVSVAALDFNRIYVVLDGQGVFRSDDRGYTWTEVNAGLAAAAVNHVAIHPVHPDIAWVALGNWRDGAVLRPGGVWKSTDGGLNWFRSSDGLAQTVTADPNQTARYGVVAVAPSNPEVLFTTNTSNSGAAVYRSLDGGMSWRLVLDNAGRGRFGTAYVPGPAMRAIEISSWDERLVLAGNTETVFRSRDGGDTWEDATAYRPTADGALWRGRGFSGLVAVNFRFHPWRAGLSALLAMDDGKFWQSDDDFYCWRWAGSGVSHWNGGNDVSFTGAEGEIYYATFGQGGAFQGIAKSADWGRTWRVFSGAARGLPALGAANSQPLGIYALPIDPDRVYAVVGGRLYLSTDGGEQWRVIHPGPGLRWIAASPDQPYPFYVNGTGGIYRSADGETLALMPGSPAGAERIALDPGDPNVVYATQWRRQPGGLYRHRNGEWVRLFDNFYACDVAVDPRDPRRIVVVTADDPYHDASFATGVWMSEDAGASWSPQNDGLFMLRGKVIRFDPFTPGRLVMGTQGRGYFVGRLKEQ